MDAVRANLTCTHEANISLAAGGAVGLSQHRLSAHMSAYTRLSIIDFLSIFRSAVRRLPAPASRFDGQGSARSFRAALHCRRALSDAPCAAGIDIRWDRKSEASTREGLTARLQKE